MDVFSSYEKENVLFAAFYFLILKDESAQDVSQISSVQIHKTA